MIFIDSFQEHHMHHRILLTLPWHQDPERNTPRPVQKNYSGLSAVTRIRQEKECRKIYSVRDIAYDL